MLSLALLVGIAGGVVLTAAAGARRTLTAYERMLRTSNAADVLISGTTEGVTYEDIRARPEVADAGVIGGYVLAPVDGAEDFGFLTYAATDGRAWYHVERPNILAGRLPSPGSADEVLVNRFLADALDLHAGDRLPVYVIPGGDPVTDPDAVPRTELVVTGIGVLANQVQPTAPNDAVPTAYAAAPFARRWGGLAAHGGMLIRVRAGTDVESLRSSAEFFQDLRDRNAKVERAIRPQGVALAAFAILAALSAFLILGQMLARQVTLASVDIGILRSLGMGRASALGLAAGRGLVVGAIGAAVAIAIAAAASSRMPIGPARLAEPSPGTSFDALTLGAGAGLIIVLLTARAALAGRNAGRMNTAGAERPSGIAAAFAKGRASAAAATGVRMALEPGRGTTAVPVRSALAGAAIAISTVVASITFGSNLDHLVSTPRAYGWDWDIEFDSAFGAFPTSVMRPLLAADPDVTAFAGGFYGNDVSVAGDAVPAIGIDALQGEAFPTMIEGRAPRAPGEVVLGTTTMRRAGARVGGRVHVVVGERDLDASVVGRAVFPALGQGGFEPTGLGEGAAMTAGELAGGSIEFGSGPLWRDGGYTFVLVRLEPGSDRDGVAARLTRGIHRRFDCAGDRACGLRLDAKPADIANYSNVRATPVVLAGLLILLAVAMVGHVLVTSVRRRGRDLAVLKTIGFVRRQVSSAVAWQASTFAVLALAAGLPIGIAAGRWTWALFANQLGVPPGAGTPVAATLLAIPITLGSANLLAAFPARSAARTQPAVVLRSE
jgi:hypothetical protein